MKITQKDIIDLILLSKTPSSDSKESQKRLAEISRDLSENGLEIEGYERVSWTKFYGEKVGFGDTCVILWRPLPKLPLEIDGRYIREDRPECFSCDTPPPGKEEGK